LSGVVVDGIEEKSVRGPDLPVVHLGKDPQGLERRETQCTNA